MHDGLMDALFGEPRLAAIYDLVEGNDGATSTTTWRSRPSSGRAACWTSAAALADVRDAPDRPGWEWVFIARKPGP